MALNLNTILGDSYWGTEANHLNQNFLLIKAAVEELDSAIISGGGRIRTVYKNSNFGGTFTENSEQDTFNAYAINQLNIRIGTLETKTYQYALSALSDVNITSAIGGQVLSFNGSKWINSNISNLLSGYVQERLIGAANGIASLDAGGKVPASQLPSYVDDVLEFSGIVNFPAVGDSGKIYIDTLTNIQYRWSGTQYVEISSSLALGETASSAYPGNKGKANADAIRTLQGTVSTLSSSLSNYLPLSGGTLTGILKTKCNLSEGIQFIQSDNSYRAGIRFIGNISYDIADTCLIITSYRAINLIPDYVTNGSYNAYVNGSKIWCAANFNPQNYLPITGGNITGDVRVTSGENVYGGQGLSVKVNSTGSTYIRYENSAGLLGIIGVEGGNPRYGGSNGVKYKIWHEGNDGSSSGLDADLLDGKHNGEINAITLNSRGNHPDGVPISGLNMYQYYGGQTVAQVTPSSYGNILSLNGTSGAVSELAMEWHGSRLFYRSKPDTSTTFTSWRELAGLDSNVASATKLQNARTIWGQSFNGTGNVSGAMSGVKTINFHNGHKIDVETGTGLDLKAASGQGVFFYTNGSTKFSGFDSTGLFSANYGIKTTELNVTGSTQIGSDLSVGNTFKANYVSSIFTNLGTGSTTTTINPNHMYVWGVVSSLNISFRVYDDLVRNEYMFQFTASSSGCNLTLPSGVKWASDNTIEAGKTYQVSVLNNMAVMAGV